MIKLTETNTKLKWSVLIVIVKIYLWTFKRVNSTCYFVLTSQRTFKIQFFFLLQYTANSRKSLLSKKVKHTLTHTLISVLFREFAVFFCPCLWLFSVIFVAAKHLCLRINILVWTNWCTSKCGFYLWNDCISKQKLKKPQVF